MRSGSIAIFAALICSTVLTVGEHPLECRAEYIHTNHDGSRYEDTVTQSYWLLGPSQVTCSGAGHPVRVTLKDLGAVVCRAEVMLFGDGFEGGSTSSWSSTGR